MPWEHALKVNLSQIAGHETERTDVNVNLYALKERAETAPFSYFICQENLQVVSPLACDHGALAFTIPAN